MIVAFLMAFAALVLPPQAEAQDGKDDKLDYSHADASEALEAVLKDAVPSIAKDRDAPKVTRLLIDRSSVPESFAPKFKGVEVIAAPRLWQSKLRKGDIYVSVEEFKPDEDGTISVAFFYAAHEWGKKSGMAHYVLQRKDDKWTVKFGLVLSIDP